MENLKNETKFCTKTICLAMELNIDPFTTVALLKKMKDALMKQLVDKMLNSTKENSDYANKTDIELLEILIEQHKKTLDPFLVNILRNKGLLTDGDNVETLKMKLIHLKKLQEKQQ